MAELVGRVGEQATLKAALSSKSPELVAIYGRRRVGKTYLVREFFDSDLCFELTGMYGAAVGTQLKNFQLALAQAIGGSLGPAVPRTWLEAFQQLTSYLADLSPKQPRVLFLDEIPWLAARRSGFLPAFEHFWNSWASKHSWLKVVVCGSAASWMREHLLRARGGLHNRVTRRIRVEPFTLGTTEQFLISQGVRLSRYQVLELYMAVGGIPHYLKEIRRGESAQQAIERVAFARDGLLRDEFAGLYRSLFDKAERHERVVRALASQPLGMARGKLLEATGLSSGGTTSTVLDELLESGFISCAPRLGKPSRDGIYRLTDPYSLFYLKWIEPRGRGTAGGWPGRRDSGRWRAWSGLAFEAICLTHIAQLKQALGIAGVRTEESAWSLRGSDSGGRGAQIDLVIERADDCTHLCEMKFSESPFVIDKRYAEELRHKRAAFQQAARRGSTLFLTFITTFGVKDNAYALELVENSVTLDALFA